MNAAAFTLCLCMSFGGGQSAPDPWFGEDKVKHFITSFVATSLSASAARMAGLEARESAFVGAGTGVAVGVLKEVRDIGRRGETASFRDLAWDFAGVGASYAVMRQVR